MDSASVSEFFAAREPAVARAVAARRSGVFSRSGYCPLFSATFATMPSPALLVRAASWRGMLDMPTAIVVATSTVLGFVIGRLWYSHPSWSAVAMIVAVLIAAAIFIRILGLTMGLFVLLVVT